MSTPPAVQQSATAGARWMAYFVASSATSCRSYAPPTRGVSMTFGYSAHQNGSGPATEE